MKAINIYVLSRKVPQNALSSFEKSLSGRSECISVRNEEIDIIRLLVNFLTFKKASVNKVSIIDAKSFRRNQYKWMTSKDYIFVDETQRMYKNSIDKIVSYVKDNIIQGCVFSYDSSQVLSIKEIEYKNQERLRSIPGFQEEKLTGRIRTNKEIAAFIHYMLHIHDIPSKRIRFDNVDINYAENEQEADKIIEFYERKGYTFISFTKSLYKRNSIDHYSKYKNSHQVIGQEFDNVIIIMDNNFKYSHRLGKTESTRSLIPWK